MRSRLFSLVGSLLILAGILVPLGAEFAQEGPGWSLRFGAQAFAYQEQDGAWTTQLDLNETRTFALESMGSLAFSSTVENKENVAPGDKDPAETGFRFTYSGKQPAVLYLTTSKSGDLTTCSGGGKFTVSVVDEQGRAYADNQAKQPVRQLQPGESVAFRVERKLDWSADNDCQSRIGRFALQGTVVEAIGPGVPPDGAPNGAAAGRLCTPTAPGAEIVATGPGGKTAALFIAAGGPLGVLQPYRLSNLAPGVWTISLNAPGGPTVQRTVTVKAGETAQVPDFSLACTGDASDSLPHLWAYLLGGALIVIGLVLRHRGKEAA